MEQIPETNYQLTDAERECMATLAPHLRPQYAKQCAVAAHDMRIRTSLHRAFGV